MRYTNTTGFRWSGIAFVFVTLVLTTCWQVDASNDSLAWQQPVPVVIWHGLGDRYDNKGLQQLAPEIQQMYPGTYVHLIHFGTDGNGDQLSVSNPPNNVLKENANLYGFRRSTFFGNANEQVEQACQELIEQPEIKQSKHFDAIGLSQGGQLLRALIERCGHELKVRNLITLGSQHMGISAVPPCPPGTSPFSPCRLMQLSLVRQGMYSTWAQKNIIPAQYFRDPNKFDEYLKVNEFLKDINNERLMDSQTNADDGDDRPRNPTYKHNFSSINKLVLLRFSQDLTVVPPHSAHFTLPDPHDKQNCSNSDDESCYPTPLPWSKLMLYKKDFIGLKRLNERGQIVKQVCQGQHMQIDAECWEFVMSWLGPSGHGQSDMLSNDVEDDDDDSHSFVIQP
ncbi:hypothetical protein OIO90_004484 [Microbotryomycetes sp. JL221]|nr:hypothetical protein OIO90_004484 [Microbotryomycetes sp. JL221]